MGRVIMMLEMKGVNAATQLKRMESGLGAPHPQLARAPALPASPRQHRHA
jgi:hypothetical protein